VLWRRQQAKVRKWRRVQPKRTVRHEQQSGFTAKQDDDYAVSALSIFFSFIESLNIFAIRG